MMRCSSLTQTSTGPGQICRCLCGCSCCSLLGSTVESGLDYCLGSPNSHRGWCEPLCNSKKPELRNTRFLSARLVWESHYMWRIAQDQVSRFGRRVVVAVDYCLQLALLLVVQHLKVTTRDALQDRITRDVVHYVVIVLQPTVPVVTARPSNQ